MSKLASFFSSNDRSKTMNKFVPHCFNGNIKRRLLVEQLCKREMLTADPVLTWNEFRSEPLIGETVDLSLSFSNQGSQTGYGPYVDVVIPKPAGDDGGIGFVAGSGSVLDFDVAEKVVQFDDLGLAYHPFAVDASGQPLALQALPGSSLVVFELPFGSFTADQPDVELDFQVSVSADARVDRSLEIAAASGFRWGLDAIDNPHEDAMIRSEAESISIQPGVIAVEIDYLGPENETATGYHYQRSYRMTVDVAEDAEVVDLSWVTKLDDSQLLRGIDGDSLAEAGFQLSTGTESGFGAEIIWEIESYQGLAGTDAVFVFDMVVPDKDDAGDWILNPVHGNDGLAIVSSAVNGLWVPPTDDLETDANVAVSAHTSHDLQIELLTTQQSVEVVRDENARGIGPGDTLEYTIDFQVSDYAELDDLVLQFSVPDGQVLAGEQTASLILHRDAKPLKVEVALSPAGPAPLGTQYYHADLSQALEDEVGSGRILGAADASIAATGALTYQTLILDEFQGSVPSNDPSIDEGDRFLTKVQISAATVNPATGVETANVTTDDSGTYNRLRVSEVETSVYAINGDSAESEPSVSPGDLVTFRISRDIRSSDVESLSLNSFLPFPIFELGDLRWVDGDGQSLRAGTIEIGPNDHFHSFYGSEPELVVDRSGNQVTLNYGSVDSIKNQSRQIDLLLTFEVQDRPFADGMWLTSLAQSQQSSSELIKYSSRSAANVLFTRPVLDLRTGVVGSDNPNAKLVSGDGGGFAIDGVDAGDLVQIESVVENTGLGKYGAFDVALSASLPDGFAIPDSGLDLQVFDPAGNLLEHVGYRSDENDDLFGGGIQLVSPIAGVGGSEGGNQVILRYELLATRAVEAGDSMVSTVSVQHYAAQQGGASFVTERIEADAEINISDVGLSHGLVATDQSHTTGRQAVVGETATYQLLARIPEGVTNNAELTIELPRGLAINEVLGVKVDDSLAIEIGDDGEIASHLSIEARGTNARDQGRLLRVPLGDIVNRDTVNQTDNQIEILYSATVINDSNVNANSSLRPKAVFRHDGGKVSRTAPALKVVEPGLVVQTLTKQAHADAADQLTISFVVSADESQSTTAFDVQFQSTIPEGASYVDGSLRSGQGIDPNELLIDDGLVSASWDRLDPTESVIIELDVLVSDSVSAGETLSGKTEVSWSSLAGEPGRITSANELSFERTANTSDPGGEVNDYRFATETRLAISPVDVEMRLLETSEDHTAGNSVTIGERAVFEVTATIPEGDHQLSFQAFDSGFDASVDIETIAIVSIGNSLEFADRLPAHEYHVDQDGAITFDLGRVINHPDNVSDDADTIVFTLTAFADDSADVTRDRTAEVVVVADFERGKQDATETLAIVEPGLGIKQSFSHDSVDAAQTVEISVVLDAYV